MPWVRGIFEGKIDDNGRIEAITYNLKVVATPKPTTFIESGSESLVFTQIRNRVHGEFKTVAHFGGATATILPFSSLALLPQNLMARLVDKYGNWGQNCIPMMVRTTTGGGWQNAAEPAGGMAESTDLQFERLEEMCELGLFRRVGWLRSVLPVELKHRQTDFDSKQEHWWNVVHPRLPPSGEAQIEVVNVGGDTLNGEPGIIIAGPVGDIQLIQVVRLDIAGTDWQVLDTESRPGRADQGELEWVPLRRNCVVIVPRIDKSPIVFKMDRDGKLDISGLHFSLCGENIGLAITHVAKAVLEALGWLGSKEKD